MKCCFDPAAVRRPAPISALSALPVRAHRPHRANRAAGPCRRPGSQGVPGPTGPQGIRGMEPHWAAGTPGPAGATGPQGPQGATGPTGPQGAAGATGPQGIRGMDGPTGPQGLPARPEPPGHGVPRAPPDQQARRGRQGPPGPPALRASGHGRPTGPGTSGPAGATGPQGPQGAAGPTGPQGTPGATGPTGPAGGPGEDVFASYYSDVRSVPNNGQIPLYELLNDPTGNITLSGTQQLRLQPGYYQVFFDVFVILASPGYLQITPSFNGQARIDLGIYFRTAGSGSLPTEPGHLHVSLPATNLPLTYSSSVDGRNVQTGLAIQKTEPACQANQPRAAGLAWPRPAVLMFFLQLRPAP
ncbi:MAG: collagen-like protein [Flavonifractor plautii]